MNNADNIHTSDMNIRPELLGLEVLLCPFPQFISSQRSAMMASNLPQALVMDGNQPPQISTGYERKFMKYDFNTTKRTDDIQVVEIIPKFQPHFGASQVKSNPTHTVIFRNCRTGAIDYFDICAFTACYDGFGYRNKHRNLHLLKKDSFIPKDVVFSTAPNHHGNLYGQGINANVAFMPMWATTEDAFVISKSLAKATSHYAITTVKVEIDKDSVPLNLYGSADDYKIMPDIDEQVGEDGIIIGIRPLEDSSFLADTTEEALSAPEYIHDNLFVAPAGSTVLDIQVYCSNKTYRSIAQSPGAFAQLIKYQDHHHTYYDKVLEIHRYAKANNLKIGSKLNCLITRCMNLKLSRSNEGARQSVQLMDKRDPVDFITLEITYGYHREVSRGFKFTGRDGAKGVVSDVWPDEDMPVDEQGIRADIIISPESAFNRMNPGQMYEQFYNRGSTLIQHRLLRGELGDTDAAVEYILQYMTDCRTVYGNFIRSKVRTREQKEQFLDGIRAKGIMLVFPPFCNDPSPEAVLRIAEKYNIGESPVTFVQRSSTGKTKIVKTKHPVCIGSKYIYLLGKIPLAMLSSVQVGYINQFGTPTKPESKSIKAQHLYSQTPIRYGEDEICMLTMSIGAETVSRFIGATANSPTAIHTVAEALLTTPNPSQLTNIDMTTDDIVATNVNVGIFTHMMGAIGYDVSENSAGR